MVKTIVFANIIILFLSFFPNQVRRIFMKLGRNVPQDGPITLDLLFKVTDLFLCKNCKTSSGHNFVISDSILIILSRNGL